MDEKSEKSAVKVMMASWKKMQGGKPACPGMQALRWTPFWQVWRLALPAPPMWRCAPPRWGRCSFSVGMFTIASCDMALFTGKLCFLLEKTGPGLAELLLCWLGNLLGVSAVGYALRPDQAGAGDCRKSRRLL